MNSNISSQLILNIFAAWYLCILFPFILSLPLSKLANNDVT